MTLLVLQRKFSALALLVCCAIFAFGKPWPQPVRYLYFFKGIHVYTDRYIVADNVGPSAAFFENPIAKRDG